MVAQFSHAQNVIESEHQYIRDSRHRNNIEHSKYTAFAISGGGIRSSSFGLGVMQSLVSANIMKDMDYLSTASGGGYIGSSLTWFLKNGLPPDGSPADVTPNRFPLGKARSGARLEGNENEEQSKPNSVLDYIRQHSNYLTPNSKLNAISLIALAIRFSLVSLAVYFLLLSSVLLMAIFIGAFHPVPLVLPEVISSLQLVMYNWFLFGVFISALTFVFVSLLYSVNTRLPYIPEVIRYKFRVFSQGLLGSSVSVTILLLIVGLLPFIDHLLFRLDMHVQAATGSTLLGTLIGIVQFKRHQSGKNPNSSSMVSVLAAALLIYGLVYGAYIFSSAIFAIPNSDYRFTASVSLMASALFFGFFVNTNYLGPHRVYRDRLMEAMLPNLESVAKGIWGKATQADTAPLSSMCQKPNERPYHLINTNIVLVDSPNSKFKGRGGDSFLLSPLFCGSDATGCIPTIDLTAKKKNGMTLATAMAISGASFNPNAGNSGKGITRNRVISTLLSLLNIRLGYWISNPKSPARRKFLPNFIYPGLTGGIFGGALHENNRVIELTDGGHFDNLALYELIRRKIDLVILADGGADADFIFDDLSNVIEKVRVDFGVQILFDDENYNLNNLQPCTATVTDGETTESLIKRYGLAKNCFAIGTIRYPGRDPGTLIYIKATMIKNLPGDVLSYKSQHPTFPHEPTADQFFNEVQVEAYRELGYCLGWEALKANGKTDSHGHWTPLNNLNILARSQI